MIRTNPSGRLTVERMIGMAKAKKHREIERALAEKHAAGLFAHVLAEVKDATPKHRAEVVTSLAEACVKWMADNCRPETAQSWLGVMAHERAPGIEGPDRRAVADAAFVGGGA